MALDPETLADVQATFSRAIYSVPPPERGDVAARIFTELTLERGLDCKDVLDAIKPVLPPLVRALLFS